MTGQPDDGVTITLTPTEWLRLCIVIKVMRDEARTNAAARILADLGLKILDRLLFWSETEVGFEHRCDRGERGTIICAPRLVNVGQPGGHQITWSPHPITGRTVPTVTPSILCPDCGTHGFITNGRWA